MRAIRRLVIATATVVAALPGTASAGGPAPPLEIPDLPPVPPVRLCVENVQLGPNGLKLCVPLP